MNDFLASTFQWIKEDWESHRVRFIIEVVAWAISIGCSITMALTVPNPPLLLLYPIWIVGCGLYAWAAPVLREGKVHMRTGTRVPINGIDRIDSEQGYILGNVRSCCSTCNYMKNRLTEDQFFEHIQKIWRRNFANI